MLCDWQRTSKTNVLDPVINVKLTFINFIIDFPNALCHTICVLKDTNSDALPPPHTTIFLSRHKR